MSISSNSLFPLNAAHPHPPVSGNHEFTSFFKIIYLFIYFWLHWVFVAACGLSSCGERGLLLVVVRGLLIAVASLVAEHGLWAHGVQ